MTLLFNIEPSTALFSIVRAPPAAIAASPDTFPKIASSKSLNVIDLIAFEASISGKINMDFVEDD